MTEGLANPLAARDHARAMAGTVVDAMPVLPPVAPDLPAGVEPDDLLWEETVAPGGYATRRLARGSRVRLIDLAGDACASTAATAAITDDPLARAALARRWSTRKM